MYIFASAENVLCSLLQPCSYSSASLPRQPKLVAPSPHIPKRGVNTGDFDCSNEPPQGGSSPSPHRDPTDSPSPGLQGMQGLSGTRVIGAPGAPRLHHYGMPGGHPNSLRLGEMPSSIRLGDMYSSYQTPAVLDEPQQQQAMNLHYNNAMTGSYSDATSYNNINSSSSPACSTAPSSNKSNSTVPTYNTGSEFYESTSAFYGNAGEASLGQLHHSPPQASPNKERHKHCDPHAIVR